MTRINPINSILIVTDNVTRRKIYQLFFGARGVYVELVGDGAEAINKFESGAFDLILNDLQSQDCHGNRIAEHIHDSGTVTPMITMTSAKDFTHPHHATVLQKPFSMETLVSKIQTVAAA
ncbi:MAG: response regulator [Desulfuromonadales bacterium]|nr:response regulator [Desulfuromonadales bacterium]